MFVFTSLKTYLQVVIMFNESGPFQRPLKEKRGKDATCNNTTATILATTQHHNNVMPMEC